MSGKSPAPRGATSSEASVTRITRFEARALRSGVPSVEPGEVHVWTFRVDKADASDWARLAETERARAKRLIIERKQVQQVAARSALRQILGAYRGLDPTQIVFEYGPHEKPALVGAPLAFNLSHSYDWAAVAIANEGRVGIDVEFASRKREFVAVAERFFSPEERAYFESLDAGSQPAAFYRAWTRKEAYLKAWGTGLSFASTRFCIDYAPGGPGCVRRTQMPQDDPERWRFVDIEVDAHYPAALCWDRVPRSVRAFRLEP